MNNEIQDLINILEALNKRVSDLENKVKSLTPNKLGSYRSSSYMDSRFDRIIDNHKGLKKSFKIALYCLGIRDTESKEMFYRKCLEQFNPNWKITMYSNDFIYVIIN